MASATLPAMLLAALGPRPLCVTPHPDDESYAFGGLATILANLGVPLPLLCMSAQAGSVRHAELVAAWATLGQGGADIIAPGWPDGALADHEAAMSAFVLAHVARFAASSIITLGPDGVYGHPDHLAVWRASRCAIVALPEVAHVHAAFPAAMTLFAPLRAWLERRAPRLLMPAEAPLPGLITATFALRPPVAAAKRAAIACHQSQLPRGDADRFFGPGVTRVLCQSETYAFPAPSTF